MNAKQEINNEHTFKPLTVEDINLIKLKVRQETAQQVIEDYHCRCKFCNNISERWNRGECGIV